MFSIVHSTWINELRARSVRKRSSMEWDDDFLENVADPVDKGPETQLMHSQIISAVERLPEAQRVVMLRGVCVFSIGQPNRICQLRIRPLHLNATKPAMVRVEQL